MGQLADQLGSATLEDSKYGKYSLSHALQADAARQVIDALKLGLSQGKVTTTL